MNDDKLAALFRDAAATPPDAGFGYLDVTRASQRITTRRRVALSGVAAVLVALAGTGVVVAATREQGALTSAAGAPAAAPEANGPAVVGSGADRAAGPVPLGPGTTECAARQDPALRALLDQALPEVAGATEAVSPDVCLPGGQRYVAVEVAGGVLSVAYLPPGTTVSLARGAVSAPTASGGTVIVQGPAPFVNRFPAVLAYLAPRL